MPSANENKITLPAVPDKSTRVYLHPTNSSYIMSSRYHHHISLSRRMLNRARIHLRTHVRNLLRDCYHVLPKNPNSISPLVGVDQLSVQSVTDCFSGFCISYVYFVFLFVLPYPITQLTPSHLLCNKSFNIEMVLYIRGKKVYPQVKLHTRHRVVCSGGRTPVVAHYSIPSP